MMFEWLGERHKDELAGLAATQIEEAVESVLGSGDTLTADLGGNASTTDVTDAVIRVI